ncbi:MAG: ADP-glyceromanno-heptose 6-epimerase [Bacteroidales bacterium]|nr:ADP-glyceromanno-heptose 6-epimerase [Bacteroidales bacterium]
MIVITGAAGFIGSNLVGKLNAEGHSDLVVVDQFNRPEKTRNLENKSFEEKIDRDDFLLWLNRHHREVIYVFHIGARTDTAEFDKSVFDRLNFGYSKEVWNTCATHSIPLLYASSAATYGMGEYGYEDSHEIVNRLKPLNPYGESKNEFDKWVLRQKDCPPFWAGMKFFNVYGPNEYHKGRMASVIFHAFNQIRQTGRMKLFRSHNPEFKDGEQKRDFIYVKDVTDVLYFIFRKRPAPGLYNLGTGEARTFLDLTKATFLAMNLDPVINFIDTPADIRIKYQYFTEAHMEKLRMAGYTKPFHSLEAGVKEYVKEYLTNEAYY